MLFWEEDLRGKVPFSLPYQGTVLSTEVISADVGLNHLPEVAFVRFLQGKLTFLPLSILCSLEGSHYAQPTLKEWEFMLQPP